ncbi:MAG: polysaccharide deacetylase family protein [Lachnospiraceae bacterium]|nr:polysaccharide deacetylase family protein [Lachnospiraceae bacterium]
MRKKAILQTLAACLAVYLLGTATFRFMQQERETSSAGHAGESWGLGFGQEGEKPTGNRTQDELSRYNAHFLDDTQDKVLYLTFDAGYENGNTAKILDALQKHKVRATFFVVGNYLETSPELVKRMVADGHSVGNHTYHHRDMSTAERELFEKEIADVEELFGRITGTELAKFYRPPQGKYCEENLQMAKDLGYHTFFWSLAYVDWYEDKQPTKEEAFSKLLGRVHPGAIVLLHSTSKTNAEILDELLTRWEEMGYRFGTLGDLITPSSGPVPEGRSGQPQ